MKHIALFLFALWVSLPVQAQTADPMRGFIWGLPQDAVQGYEPAELIGAEAGMLAYSGVVVPDLQKEPLNVYIEYRFADNRLEQIRYDFVIKEGDPGQTMDDIMTLQLWLDAVFNQTSKPEFRFNDPAVRGDTSRWGWAIYGGEGSMVVNWATPDTKAVLSFSGNDEYEPRLTLRLHPVKSALRP